jgi:Toastrack DUF4097
LPHFEKRKRGRLRSSPKLLPRAWQIGLGNMIDDQILIMMRNLTLYPACYRERFCNLRTVISSAVRKTMRYGTLSIVALLLSCVVVVARADDKKQQVERTTPADPSVVISACVVSGSLTVHGWDRKEVHVRASDGVPIELKRVDLNKSELATELRLATRDNRSQTGNSCLPMGDIEMDVPRAATVKLDTSEGDISVTGVASVTARSQAGTITLAKLKGGVDAATIGGDISVREAAGSIRIRTVGGTVDARDLTAGVEGDSFEAGTVSGDITLDRVTHQRLKVNTVSGSLSYSGPLARDGSYSFQAISGGLTMSLPADSSFRITGTLGRGNLSSDFALKYSMNEDLTLVSKHTNIHHIDALTGTGNASIKISFFQSSVTLRKK